MGVSERDKDRMRRLAADLTQVETDDRGTAEHRARVRAWSNDRRARHGLPSLDDDDEHPPEEGIYRRAIALGMDRIDRCGPR